MLFSFPAEALKKTSQTDVLGFVSDAGPSINQVETSNLHYYVGSRNFAKAAVTLLPDLVAHSPSDLGLLGDKEAGTLRLKFTTRFSNQGQGPLEVRAQDNSARLVQVVYHENDDQPMAERPTVGRFAVDQSHGHLHLEDFAHYQLWSVNEDDEIVTLFVSNPKVGFCLLDAELRFPELAKSDEAIYWGCRSEVQGVSVGWGDLYAAQLARQDLNISDLPDGRYALVNIINHKNRLLESDYSNNQAKTFLSLENGRLILD